MGFMFPAHGNLGRFGNSAAWWLGIQPYELFFYVFLPPLLLDAAVRIDFFLFKKARACPLGALSLAFPNLDMPKLYTVVTMCKSGVVNVFVT